jgi:beta-galactosidase GanA
MDTTKLHFYIHEPTNNKYTPLLSDYWIDEAGFLHFLSDRGGYVVLSEGPLKLKTAI